MPHALWNRQAKSLTQYLCNILVSWWLSAIQHSTPAWYLSQGTLPEVLVSSVCREDVLGLEVEFSQQSPSFGRASALRMNASWPDLGFLTWSQAWIFPFNSCYIADNIAFHKSGSIRKQLRTEHGSSYRRHLILCDSTRVRSSPGSRMEANHSLENATACVRSSSRPRTCRGIAPKKPMIIVDSTGREITSEHPCHALHSLGACTERGSKLLFQAPQGGAWNSRSSFGRSFWTPNHTPVLLQRRAHRGCVQRTRRWQAKRRLQRPLVCEAPRQQSIAAKSGTERCHQHPSTTDNRRRRTEETSALKARDVCWMKRRRRCDHRGHT